MTWGVRAATSAAALAGVLVLAGCTSSHTGAASSAPSGGGESPTLLRPIPADPAPSTSGSQPVTSQTPTSTPPPPKPKPTGPIGCTAAQLKVGVERGSAAAGQEFAVVTFANTGPTTCTISGFPGVSLRLNHALLGAAAQRSAKAASTVTLKPGAQAEANVTDFSSCQAPVSDTVRVYAPNQRAFTDLPLSLRGCRVVIDPVTHS